MEETAKTTETTQVETAKTSETTQEETIAMKAYKELQAKSDNAFKFQSSMKSLVETALASGYDSPSEYVEALTSDWQSKSARVKELEAKKTGEEESETEVERKPKDELSPRQIMALADNSRETQLTRFSLDKRFEELSAETKTDLDKTVKGWIRNNPDMLAYAKSQGITWHELAYNLKLVGDPTFRASLEKQAIAKEDTRRSKNAQQETITSDIPAKQKQQLSELDEGIMKAGT